MGKTFPVKHLFACLGIYMASLCLSGNVLGQSLSSSLTPPPVCTGRPFQYIPTSSSGGVSFTWTRAAVAGIANPAGSGTGAVNDTLINTTTSAVTVTYVFTLTQGAQTNTQQVQVVVEPNPNMNFSIDDTGQCLQGNVFNFTSSVSIGTGSVTKYNWFFASAGGASTQNASATFGTPGRFQVTLICTTDQGCQDGVNKFVTVYPAPVADFTYALTPPSSGDQYSFNNLSADGASGITGASWNFGDGATSTQYQGPTHTYAPGGPYSASLTVTNSEGCTATVTEPITLPATASGGTADFSIVGGNAGACLGTAFTFTDNNTGTVTGESWNFGDGTTVAALAPQTHTYAAAGYYVVTETVTFSDGSTARVAQSVSVFPAPVLTLTTGDQTICSGSVTSAVYFKPANAGLSYSWTVSNPSMSVPGGSGANIPSFKLDSLNATQSTTVMVSGNSPYGCPVTGKSIVITENPLPSLTNGFPSEQGCNGQPLTLPAWTSSLPATTYTWTNTDPLTGLPASGSGQVSAFTAINYSANPTSSTVMVTPKAGGCSGAAHGLTYTVYPAPVITDSLKDTSICSGVQLKYSGDPTLGASIAWARDSVTGVQPGTGSGGAAIAETLRNQTSNPITVPYIYTLKTATCTTLDTINVTLGPSLRLTSPTDTALCSGTRFAYTPASGTAGAAYSWTRSAMAGLSNPAASGAGAIDETLTSTDTAMLGVPYVYTITSGGCSNTTVLNVNLEPIPTLAFPAGTGQTLCPGVASAPVDWVVTPYNTPVQWTNDNTNIGLAPGGTGNVASFTAMDASTTAITGDLSAVARSAAGCTSGPVTGYVITVNPSPTAVLDTPSGTLLCLGSSLPLNATGGTTYQWTLGGSVVGTTGAQYLATLPGLYTVTAFTAQGCGDSASVTLNYIPKPTAAFTFQTSCLDTPVAFTNTSADNGASPVTWLWTDNAGHSSTAASPVFTYGSSGNYRVSLVATPDGCPGLADSAVKNLAITTPPPGSFARTFAVSEKATDISAPGYNGASYVWTPAAGLSNPDVVSPSVTITGPQTYYITITQPSGCVTTDTLEVDLIAPEVVYVPTGFTPNGDGHNDLLVIGGLNNYPGSGLLVFNRWGSKVYESTNYANNWDGGGNPPGTYVYVLQLKVGENSYLMKKGWIEIMK